MPKKNKTHSGSKKRFRTTAKGRIKRSHCGASHLLTKKGPARRRKLRSSTLLKGGDEKKIKKLLNR
jgi:large subunit ribosomal protein L35